MRLERGNFSPCLSLSCVKPKVKERFPASKECNDTIPGYLSIKIFLNERLQMNGKFM